VPCVKTLEKVFPRGRDDVTRAPDPRHCVFSLARIRDRGVRARDYRAALEEKRRKMHFLRIIAVIRSRGHRFSVAGRKSVRYKINFP